MRCQSCGIVEGEVQGIGFMINLQSHKAPFIVCRAFPFRVVKKEMFSEAILCLMGLFKNPLSKKTPDGGKYTGSEGRVQALLTSQVIHVSIAPNSSL